MTAQNTPTSAVAPIKQDTLIRMAAALERLADAAERAAAAQALTAKRLEAALGADLAKRLVALPGDTLTRMAAALERLADAAERAAAAERAHPVALSGSYAETPFARPHVEDAKVSAERNLFMCAVCRLADGELTTECPGWPVPASFGAEVYAGRADFVHGQWTGGKNPTNQKLDRAKLHEHLFTHDAGSAWVCECGERRKKVEAPVPGTAAPAAASGASTDSTDAPGAAVKPGAGSGPGDGQGVSSQASQAVAITPLPAPMGQELAVALIAKRLEAALGADLAKRLVALPCDTQNADVARLVKTAAVERLGEPAFVTARDKRGWKGRLPTNAELVAFVLEEFA